MTSGNKKRLRAQRHIKLVALAYVSLAEKFNNDFDQVADFCDGLGLEMILWPDPEFFQWRGCEKSIVLLQSINSFLLKKPILTCRDRINIRGNEERMKYYESLLLNHQREASRRKGIMSALQQEMKAIEKEWREENYKKCGGRR